MAGFLRGVDFVEHLHDLAQPGLVERCLELGLANKVVPAASLLDETLAWARSLAERAPLSIAATKKAMRHATSASWASTFDLEAPMQNRLRKSADSAEGVRAFFEKRKANFQGK